MRILKKHSPHLTLLLLGITFLLLSTGTEPGYALWLLAVASLLQVLLLQKGRCSDFVVWSDDYSVGIESIDNDHKKLLNLINNLQAAVMCDTGKEFETNALKELMDYTHYHFQREEGLMKEANYFDFEGHKGQHDQMIIQAQVFIDRYREKGRDALPEVTSYLRLWLIQHINGTDRKYAPYLLAKGIQ